MTIEAFGRDATVWKNDGLWRTDFADQKGACEYTYSPNWFSAWCKAIKYVLFGK